MEKYVKETISEMLRGDGGWVEFISYNNGILKLLFRAECSKCIVLDRCIEWMKGRIKDDLGETVEIEAVRKKPYFWGN